MLNKNRNYCTMSPEPTQKGIEENLNAPNLPIDARIGNDSDSEDDDIEMAGYLPLSQVPTDGDPILDEDEDDEWVSTPGETNHIAISSIELTRQQEHPSEVVEVWSSPCNRSNIDLDADKIDQVKSMMASFKLPTTSIPEWANTISEDQWKEQLMERMKEMQDRNKQA